MWIERSSKIDKIIILDQFIVTALSHFTALALDGFTFDMEAHHKETHMSRKE